MSDKERLDILVQRLGNMSRSKAQGLIQTGQVTNAAGEVLDKVGVRLDEETELVIKAKQRFVSRGGYKLEGAFEAFPIDVQGRVCLDAGASTGGFTDCLLQHGAAKVYAVDVGYGQLAWQLQQDPRVIAMDRVNVRHLKPEDLPEPPSFFTVDCSFISLKVVLPAIVDLVRGQDAHAPLAGKMPAPQFEGVALIKPQFEAGRENVGKGGVVRDEKVRESVVQLSVLFARSLGFHAVDVIPSPLLGPAGNHEFLAYLHEFKPEGE